MGQLGANDKWVIYALKDPRDNQVRYVGFTTRPEQRLKRHINHTRQGRQTYCACWIRQLLKLELKPVMDILEYGCGPDWKTREKYHISLWRSIAKLTNLTDGGEGTLGWKPPDEWRAKMSKAHKGLVHTEETRAKMSKARKGKPLSIEHCAAVSKAKTGVPFSIKQCAAAIKAGVIRRRYDRSTPEAQQFFKIITENDISLEHGCYARRIFKKHIRSGKPLSELPAAAERYVANVAKRKPSGA